MCSNKCEYVKTRQWRHLGPELKILGVSPPQAPRRRRILGGVKPLQFEREAAHLSGSYTPAHIYITVGYNLRSYNVPRFACIHMKLVLESISP